MHHKKDICILGLWHQGIVAASCLAEKGFNVIAADEDQKKINDLCNGISTIYEPGLEGLLKKGIKNGNLQFTNNLSEAVKDKEFIFLMFDTPVDKNDISDLSTIFKTIKNIAKYLQNNAVIWNTSQVPVGTSEEILRIINEINPYVDISIAYTPENLRLGQAIKLFLEPGLPLIGSDDSVALEKIENLLKPLEINWMKVNLRTAEVCKHALNSYLASTITFANELGNICDVVGADGFAIAKALRLEPRISPKAMLRPGMGFSGGTLARDVQTLRNIGDRYGIDTHLLDGLWQTNIYQNQFVIRKLKNIFGNLKDKTISILGITYKPETSTLRRSVALETISSLHKLGANIKAHDPKADKNELKQYGGFTFYDNFKECLVGADAIAIITGWEEYSKIDWNEVKQYLSNYNIIDCNNLYEYEELISKGYKYFCIGRGLL